MAALFHNSDLAEYYESYEVEHFPTGYFSPLFRGGFIEVRRVGHLFKLLNMTLYIDFKNMRFWVE